MKLSELFTKTSKQYPKDEVSASAQLLIRAGYIDKAAAGIYTLLPLGSRVINNLVQIIREEMEAVGGQEITMPGLIPKKNYDISGRWNDFDVLFKLKGADEKEYALGPTHEEIISPLTKRFIHSYRDLPFAAFQIQNKFRNELRAKSGILRTREFLMKDLYSFHTDEGDLNNYYERVAEAYWKVWERCGIKDKTYYTYASGGTFSKFSHEFQTETSAGEDEVWVCKKCKNGINRDIIEGEFRCPGCAGVEYDVKKCVEVGNIFKLRAKFSEPYGLNYVDERGEEKPVEMGCYGIGLQRLMGAVAEVHHDEKGLMWPDEIAPYQAYLFEVKSEKLKVKSDAEEIYKKLQEAGISVLYDDREDVSAGEKFADADLIGLPCRLVVSEKTGDKIEIKKRSEEKTELESVEEAIEVIRS